MINNLVFNQNNTVDYVLYAIKYAVDHPEMKLTNPEGLYRICKDTNVYKTYHERKASQLLQGQTVKIETIQQTHFDIKNTKKKTSVSDLFG